MNTYPSNSGWIFGGGTTEATWEVNMGIFYREKLIGDTDIFWCPVHFDQYNLTESTKEETKEPRFWKAEEDTGHVHYWRLWTSYMMNGNVYYTPSGAGGVPESRLSSEFTSNHFLFMEENENKTKGRFNDGMMDGTHAKDTLSDRHQGYGFIACMDGHVIKMDETRFELTKRTKATAQAGEEEFQNEHVESRWKP
jgi:hypothetical protein